MQYQWQFTNWEEISKIYSALTKQISKKIFLIKIFDIHKCTIQIGNSSYKLNQNLLSRNSVNIFKLFYTFLEQIRFSMLMSLNNKKFFINFKFCNTIQGSFSLEDSENCHNFTISIGYRFEQWCSPIVQSSL